MKEVDQTERDYELVQRAKAVAMGVGVAVVVLALIGSAVYASVDAGVITTVGGDGDGPADDQVVATNNSESNENKTVVEETDKTVAADSGSRDETDQSKQSTVTETESDQNATVAVTETTDEKTEKTETTDETETTPSTDETTTAEPEQDHPETANETQAADLPYNPDAPDTLPGTDVDAPYQECAPNCEYNETFDPNRSDPSEIFDDDNDNETAGPDVVEANGSDSDDRERPPLPDADEERNITLQRNETETSDLSVGFVGGDENGTVTGGDNATFDVRVSGTDPALRSTDTLYVELHAGPPNNFIIADIGSANVSDGVVNETVTLTYQTPPVEQPTEKRIEAVAYTNTSDPSATTTLTLFPGNNSSDQWSDEEREKAAKMIRAYYEGYIDGVIQNTEVPSKTEANGIERGNTKPWPLGEWNSTEDARSEGVHLGASEGAEPFGEEFGNMSPNTTHRTKQATDGRLSVVHSHVGTYGTGEDSSRETIMLRDS